jgi:hypothetical protein
MTVLFSVPNSLPSLCVLLNVFRTRLLFCLQRA